MEFTNKERRKFVCMENVSKFLFCSICDEIFRNPVRLKSCGHTYCLSCILQWSKHNLNCPLCRVNFTENDIRVDKIATNIINDLEVYCLNSGCPWKGRLNDFSSHIKECYFNPGKMPEYIKEVLDYKKENDKEKNNENEDCNDDEDNEEISDDNNLTSFNIKSTLRARLYNRNRELVNKVYSKSWNRDKSNKKESDLLNIIKENNLAI